MFNNRTLGIVAAALLLVALCAADVSACPNCKDSLAQNDPTASGLVQGYFWSILFLLSMPFTILTGMATYFYLLVRQARLATASAVVPSGAVTSAVVASSAGMGEDPFAPTCAAFSESRASEEVLV